MLLGRRRDAGEIIMANFFEGPSAAGRDTGDGKIGFVVIMLGHMPEKFPGIWCHCFILLVCLEKWKNNKLEYWGQTC